MGSTIMKSHIQCNGLSVNISQPVVLYHDNIVLLRCNRSKASDNNRQLND